MREILSWELRSRRTAIIWWAVGSIILSLAIVLLYPSVRNQANQLNNAINSLPAGLRDLKTGGGAQVNVADPVQFLNSQLFYATLPILWIIFAITRGAAVLGRDEQNHTLELLLSRPVSRSTVLFAKALSLIVELIIVAAASLSAILLVAPHVQLHIAILHLALATAYSAAFALSFGLIAYALRAATGLARRVATAVAVLIGFGGYVLASLSGLTSWLQGPAKFAPYHYFAPDKILGGQTVFGLNAYLIGVFIVTCLVAYLGFRERDIE